MTDNINGGVESDPNGRYIRYPIELGKGAYKTVYRGFDTFDALEVAWNKLNLNRLSDIELDKVSREVKFLQNLNHKNIISCYASWDSINSNGKAINFITELMMSGTLKEYIARAKAIKLKVIRRWCCNILEAICYLHSQDPPIMHRDIKCDNLFINGHVGEVKLGDLGLSGFKSQDKAITVIGTPEFMAPELYEESYTEKVDVYAFGMCVLEMLTMEYPYSECQNPAQIFKKVYNGEKPAALSKLVDCSFKDAIVKCLKREAERPSAMELLEDPLFKDWASDPCERSNVHLLKGQEGKFPTAGPDGILRELKHNHGPMIHPGVDRTVIISRFTDAMEEETTIAANGAFGKEVRISVHIPIEGATKKIEFSYDLDSDSPQQLADEMVEEFNLDPMLHVPTIRKEIEEQVHRAIQDSKIPAHAGRETGTEESTSSPPSGQVSRHSSRPPSGVHAPPAEAHPKQMLPAAPDQVISSLSQKSPRTVYTNGSKIQKLQSISRPDGPAVVVIGELPNGKNPVAARDSPRPTESPEVTSTNHTATTGTVGPHTNGPQPKPVAPLSIPQTISSAYPSSRESNSATDRKRSLLCMELMTLSKDGKVEKVRKKLIEGADPNYADHNKRTALHLASISGHVEVAEVLLENGADPEARDNRGSTAVMVAKSHGQSSVLEMFKKHGVEIYEDDDECPENMVLGMELLNFAARGAIDLVRERLFAGVPVSFMDYDNRTALHVAASEGHAEVAELLILNGAGIDTQDVYGRTPVDDAVKNGHKEVLLMFSKYGAWIPEALLSAKVASENQLGRDLIEESKNSDVDKVNSLLELGANVNFQNYDHRTPLHVAASEGIMEMVKLLLSRGADPGLTDRWGNTPLDDASRLSKAEIAALLSEPTDVDRANSSDESGPTEQDSSVVGSPPVISSPPLTPLVGRPEVLSDIPSAAASVLAATHHKGRGGKEHSLENKRRTLDGTTNGESLNLLSGEIET
uniref:Protein kinase domain-containing protein n=1 Tax=Compsopogon caeruleus TaxID=31354 RepID=A0A7S1TGP6_9RHOD|mmetsp:Transcript_6582/g.13289  ORF Transcript_6582/g.13289 Transcript_6582/m.13289 type:complete len:978 (+) Transcript_6582:421-3354(+)